MKQLIWGTLLAFSSLSADVQQVTIRWDANICTPSCIKDLQKRLGEVRGIEKLAVTATSASFSWKSGAPFSFRAVDAGMRYVGVRMRDIFVTVDGTLSHDDEKVYLRSINDGTSFTLLSPLQFAPNQAAAQKNIESHTLTPELRKRLIEAEEAEMVATIQGPLFQPYASPPLNLIIAEMKLTEKKSENR